MPATHVPVLLDEVLDALQPEAAGVLFDGTLGLGGHAAGWLRATAERGAVGRCVATDRDAAALARARERLEAEFPGRLAALHASYEDAPRALAEAGLDRVDAALLDLGASSVQLDSAARGFSFQAPGPLDMRMDPDSGGRTAAELVNDASEAELADVFARFGEEPAAERVARAIVAERRAAPFRDTLRFAECVARACGGRRGRLHPATRVFQALRIAVNDELGRLARGLPAVAACVRRGGRFAVLSFHRLEDAAVKRFFRAGAQGGRFRELADRTPSRAEQARNPRSRSARLRAVEVLTDAVAPVASGDRT